MKPSLSLERHRAAVREIVERHRASNARIFGSIAVGEDTDGSDLDLLIEPSPEMTLFDLGAIRHELRELLGIEVDVLTPGALPVRFRQQVLDQAKPL